LAKGVRVTTKVGTATKVRTATPKDLDRVVDAIVLAFARDPIVRWVYAEPHQYVTGFREFVPAFGGKAFENETAHYAGEFVGAALWLPPGVEPEEPVLVEIIERTVDAQKVETLFGILEAMGKHHPPEPHWYLPLIGVDPTHQGRGIGGALLRHTLEHVDQQQSLAYLESSNPANIPLYERHGFEVLGRLRSARLLP
jgi:ribosomal protein S18 acetylase RimI-like enzyme